MSFMLLLILALVSLQPRWPEAPQWLDDLSIGPLTATLGLLFLIWTAGSFFTWLCCREMRGDPGRARLLLKRFHGRQKQYFLLLTCAFLMALYFIGWGEFVSILCWDDPRAEALWPFEVRAAQFREIIVNSRYKLAFWPGKQLVLLAPFLAVLACSWARFYDAEKTLYQLDGFNDVPFLGRLTYLGLQARFNLLLFVPPLFLMQIRELFLWIFPETRNSELIEQVFFATFLLFALLGMPWLLRVFLRLHALPAGPLRERLEATVRRLKFRFSALLLWNTRNCSANAFVTGILPWPRYIVLTDQLLRDLSPDEVEAVIGHEVGHVRHHHMFFYMLFLFGSLIMLGLLWQLCVIYLVPTLTPWLPTSDFEMISPFPLLLGMSLYLFVVFGYLSRFCETQADIFGSRTISNEVFISALEKVAVLNSIPREKPGWLSSWRHPTIAKRVDFLRRMDEDPALEPRFQRRIGLFKWSLALILSALLVTLWLISPKENGKEVGKSEGRLQQLQ